MSDLLQEIDEAMKREKAAQFWKENGPYIIGGAVLLVAMTGIFTAWNSWQLKKNTAQTNLLVSALSSPFPETALDAAAASLKGEHKAAAELHRAAYLIQANKNGDALAVLDALRKDGGAPALWRDLATLMAARLRFEKEADQAAAQDIVTSLKPLMKAGNAWQAQARIEAAIITADGLKDARAALEYLNPLLQDAGLPQTLKDRAQALDHLYGLRAAAQKKDSDKTDLPESKG